MSGITTHSWIGVVLCLFASAHAVQAQSFTGAGSSWSSGWSFSSATDRSIALQQAQIIKQAEEPVNPTTVVNTYYDNRSNYVEATSENGDVTTDYQIGDEIGENTYAVGSLNTGNTTITVDGNDNSIDAINSAETNGCVDGSIASSAPVYPTEYSYTPVVAPCQ